MLWTRTWTGPTALRSSDMGIVGSETPGWLYERSASSEAQTRQVLARTCASGCSSKRVDLPSWRGPSGASSYPCFCVECIIPVYRWLVDDGRRGPPPFRTFESWSEIQGHVSAPGTYWVGPGHIMVGGLCCPISNQRVLTLVLSCRRGPGLGPCLKRRHCASFGRMVT